MKRRNAVFKNFITVLLTAAMLMSHAAYAFAFNPNTASANDKKVTYAEAITDLVKIITPDSQIPEVKSKKHKSDKYVLKADEMSFFESGELVKGPKGFTFKELKDYPDSKVIVAGMDDPIPKQDIIRYACRILKIKWERNFKVFQDVETAWRTDIEYTSAAYFEYLVEPIGRDKGGRKLFGFNKAISRGEFDAMLKNIAEYKQNSEIYKKKKATARAAADKAELQKQSCYKAGDEYNYTLIDGYMIPLSETYRKALSLEVAGISSGDFFALIAADLQSRPLLLWYEKDDQLYHVLQKVLESKFGSDTASQILTYVKKKKSFLDELPAKQWETKSGITITVESGRSARDVIIMGRIKGKKY